jgi:type I restriction enzyme S subunit
MSVIFNQGTIEELCNVEYGTRVVRKKDAGTIYPVYGGGGETFFLDTFNREDRVVVARFAMSEKCTRRVSGKFALNDSGLTLSPKKPEILSQDFLDYLVLNLNDQIYKSARGTAQKNLDVPAFRLIKVSYPDSLEEQQKIVEKLDGAFAEIADLEMRIDLLKNFISEMESSTLNSVLANSKRKLRIGDICTVTSSKRVFKSEYVEDGIPFYRTKELKELANKRKIRTELFISMERFSEIKNKYGIPINGDLLISAVGTIGEVLVIDNLGDFYFKDGNIVWLKSISSDFDSNFLAMCLRNITKMLNDTAQGSAYSALTIEKLVEIEIPEISKMEQLEIIKKFSELSQSIKEFEYNLVKKTELVFELRKSFLRDALEREQAVA